MERSKIQMFGLICSQVDTGEEFVRHVFRRWDNLLEVASPSHTNSAIFASFPSTSFILGNGQLLFQASCTFFYALMRCIGHLNIQLPTVHDGVRLMFQSSWLRRLPSAFAARLRQVILTAIWTRSYRTCSPSSRVAVPRQRSCLNQRCDKPQAHAFVFLLTFSKCFSAGTKAWVSLHRREIYHKGYERRHASFPFVVESLHWEPSVGSASEQAKMYRPLTRRTCTSGHVYVMHVANDHYKAMIDV
jgi:hypothetical protein